MRQSPLLHCDNVLNLENISSPWEAIYLMRMNLCIRVFSHIEQWSYERLSEEEGKADLTGNQSYFTGPFNMGVLGPSPQGSQSNWVKVFFCLGGEKTGLDCGPRGLGSNSPYLIHPRLRGPTCVTQHILQGLFAQTNKKMEKVIFMALHEFNQFLCISIFFFNRSEPHKRWSWSCLLLYWPKPLTLHPKYLYSSVRCVWIYHPAIFASSSHVRAKNRHWKNTPENISDDSPTWERRYIL